MIAHPGYIIPFNVRSGLVNMNMRSLTDDKVSLTEPKALPQTVITSDLDWDPSLIDYEYDDEQWFDAMENLPDLNYDIPFDEYGEYLQTNEIATCFAKIEKVFDVQMNTLLMHKTQSMHQKDIRLQNHFQIFRNCNLSLDGYLSI